MASKSKKTWGTIARFALPILGGLIGGPVGAGIGGAAGGALSGEKGALKQAAIGGLAGYGGAKLFGAGGSGGKNPLGGIGDFLSNMNPFKSGTAYAAPASGATSFAKQAIPNSGFSGITSAGPGVAVNAIKQQASKGGFGFGSLMKNPLMLGAGIMGASQFIKSPEVPELPQSVIDFQNAARQGNPLQNRASAALMEQLNTPFEQLSGEEEAAINRQYDMAEQDELKSIDSMYKSLRPGTDPLTDSAYQKDLGRVRDRYATLRADSISQARRQVRNDFTNQRAQQIAQAAGLSGQQPQQHAHLSQFDLDRQLTQLQISDRDRQTLRDYLLQFGGNLASNQLDPTKALEMQLYQKLLSGGFN